jgi:uncharacterized protein (TIGR00661 family)
MTELQTVKFIEEGSINFPVGTIETTTDIFGPLTFILKKSIFDKINRMNCNFKGWGWEDLEFASRLIEKYEITELDIYGIHLFHPRDITNELENRRIFNEECKDTIVYQEASIENMNEVIISDNRYGMFSEKIPSVFISHQLNIIIPNAAVSFLVNRLNKHYLNKFDKIWVPDFEDEPNLSGILGHNAFEGKTIYIGPLSRLNPDIAADKHYDIVALLSGPEPQRSYFEKLLLEQLTTMNLKTLIVQGRTDSREVKSINGVSFKPFADENEVAALLKGASMIIARSGYSTIMDMAKMGVRKVLLVPTPGQTEQEYLAKKLAAQGAVISQQQHEINIKKAWNDITDLKGISSTFNQSLLTKAVSELMKFIEKSKA